MSIKITKCDKNDAKEVGIVYDKVVRYLDEHINYPRWTYKEYPSEKYAREMIKRGGQFKIEKDGVLVGAFVLNDDPTGNYAKVDWSLDLKDREYLVLHALAIDYDYSRQGIGKKVVEFCKEETKRRGLKSLRVDIVPDNEPARRLYEGCGFLCRGVYDLDRNIDFIPLFSLFEYDL